MEGGQEDMGLHVVLLPWTSQGHITPVVQLGEVLAARTEGLRVTLVVTARVKARFDRAASPRPHPPQKLWSSPAFIYCIGCYHHCLVSSGVVPLKGKSEETWITCIPGLPPIHATDFVKEFLQTQEEVDVDFERFQRLRKYTKDIYGTANEQYRILVNTVYELDSEALYALCADGVQALAIGPLFLQTTRNKESGQPVSRLGVSAYEEDCSWLQWLDGKESASVLYIAFGSEAKIVKDEMQELAHGLEASGKSFLWIIRPGSVVDENSIGTVLPEGFQERMRERGQIVSWAPQMDVLAHPSIGGFLSHCGWNSTLETLWLGVPILGWPQRADQGVNKRFIEEQWKVGIVVEKHEGGVTRSSSEKAIRALMQEGGALVRERVKETQKLLCKTVQEGGSSQRNLDTFVHDLCNLVDRKEERAI
ncbi:hypothetical protein L7F22_000700 [Adiantum nelumboides]|nr:hypothetical protein [Adiantum nelumboides]